MSEKRRGSSSAHVAVLVVCMTTVLLLWRHSGCPGPPVHTPPAYLLIVPGNLTSLPPPYNLDSLPPGDEARLVNLQDFHFILNNDVCNTTSEPLVIVLIHSAPRNQRKRAAIRETWGSQMKVVFLMGSTTNAKRQALVLAENDAHHDIVQGSFIDAYRNMTYKHVMGLKWVSYYCSGARYILKTDDDVFVHPTALIHYLTTSLSFHGARRLILCHLFNSPIVQRSYRSKWRVSFSEYRPNIYPDYCPGWAIMYSPDAVFDLYKESQKADYFWIDDVFVTGLMAERANIPRSTLGNLVLSADQVDTIDTKEPHEDFFIFGPADLSIEKIYKLWKTVQKWGDFRPS